MRVGRSGDGRLPLCRKTLSSCSRCAADHAAGSALRHGTRSLRESQMNWRRICKEQVSTGHRSARQSRGAMHVRGRATHVRGTTCGTCFLTLGPLGLTTAASAQSAQHSPPTRLMSRSGGSVFHFVTEGIQALGTTRTRSLRVRTFGFTGEPPRLASISTPACWTKCADLPSASPRANVYREARPERAGRAPAVRKRLNSLPPEPS